MDSQLIKKFLERWGSSDFEVAVERAVQSVFPDIADWSIPVNPYDIARRCGIVSILTTDIPYDGIISRNEAGDYMVELNSNNSKNRRRFTVAHEIGHTFFFNLEGSVHSRFRLVDGDVNLLASNRTEEVLCNLIAAEILMPFSQLSEKGSTLPPTAKTIATLAATFEVSINAMARRVAQVMSHNLMICALKYNPSLYVFESDWVVRSGKLFRSSGKLIISSDQPIFSSLLKGKPFRGRQWVSLGGPLDDYWIDAMTIDRAGQDYLMVVLFDRSADVVIQYYRARGFAGEDDNPETEQLELF